MMLVFIFVLFNWLLYKRVRYLSFARNHFLQNSPFFYLVHLNESERVFLNRCINIQS